MKLRLASVSFLNALPLTWGFSSGSQRGRFELILAPPFACADMIRRGEVDAALVPSIEAERLGGVGLVPGTCISSRREVRSVIVMSRVEPASIRSLAVDSNSRTSVALARILLERRYGCRPALEAMPPRLGPMLSGHDAALLIGDAALRASLDPDGDPSLHRIDLAREWYAMTGEPFVFAVWVCRRGIDPSGLASALEASLAEGLGNIDAIASAQQERTGIPSREIATYLRDNIHFVLGEEEIHSLRRFHELCRQEGMLPAQAGGAVASSSSATTNSG